MLNQQIALGTAQFGLPYGVANQSGQVSRDEMSVILEHARLAGLNTLDTAIAYGDSEERLGEIGVGYWQVITKLPAIPDTGITVADWVKESVIGSLKRLRISRLYGLLLHRSQELLGQQGLNLFEALTALKDQGIVEKVGISIYSPDELEALLPHFHFDIVQAPFNIVDRRLATTGWLARLRDSGTEVHTRSVFLQGLLLMEDTKRPVTFNRWQMLWERWHRWLNDQSLTPVEACLSFVMSQPGIDRVVIGVDSLKQLQQILACIPPRYVIPPANLMSEDIDLINPSMWSKH